METYVEKGGQAPHITNYTQEVTSDSGSFTQFEQWQSLLDKNFYGSTDMMEAMVKKKFTVFNLLKTKRNLLYTRNHFVPRSKHFPPRL